MISLAARGTLLSLGLVLATAFAARPATAGSIGFWSGPNCADPNTVSSHFNGTFGGSEKCEALCKVSASACRGAVKDAVSCSKGEGASYYKAFGVVCSTLSGTAKQDCVAELKASKAGFKESLAGDKASALATCADLRDSCIMSCAAPL